MRRYSHKTYFRCKIRPHIWLIRARFPICREILEIGPRFHVFLANFLLRMRRNGQNTASGQIFNPKFEIYMNCFLFEYKFWWSFRQDLYVFCAKNCFRNAKFSEFWGYWGWGEIFLSKPPKGTSLPDFTRFELSIVQIRSRDFVPDECTKKNRDTTKSHREVIFHVLAGNSPPNHIQPKSAYE